MVRDRERYGSRGRYLYPVSLVNVVRNDSYENDRVFMDWLRVRQVIEHEDYLLIERAKLLIAVQTILSALIYFVLNSSYGSAVLPSVLSVFGMIMSLHLTVGMYKAKSHQNKLINWWFSRVGFESQNIAPHFLYPFILIARFFKLDFKYQPREKNELPELIRAQPPIVGKDPGIGKFNWSLPYWGIGAMFCLIWAAAFVAFISGLEMSPIKT